MRREALSQAEVILRPEASGFPPRSAKRLPSWWAESSSDSVLAERRTVQMGSCTWRLAGSFSASQGVAPSDPTVGLFLPLPEDG